MQIAFAGKLQPVAQRIPADAMRLKLLLHDEAAVLSLPFGGFCLPQRLRDTFGLLKRKQKTTERIQFLPQGLNP